MDPSGLTPRSSANRMLKIEIPMIPMIPRTTMIPPTIRQAFRHPLPDGAGWGFQAPGGGPPGVPGAGPQPPPACCGGAPHWPAGGAAGGAEVRAGGRGGGLAGRRRRTPAARHGGLTGQGRPIAEAGRSRTRRREAGPSPIRPAPARVRLPGIARWRAGRPQVRRWTSRPPVWICVALAILAGGGASVTSAIRSGTGQVLPPGDGDLVYNPPPWQGSSVAEQAAHNR